MFSTFSLSLYIFSEFTFFKGNYRATTGFGQQEGSIVFVTLFLAYFSFLRPHVSLENKVPVIIPKLEKMPNIPEMMNKANINSSGFPGGAAIG